MDTISTTILDETSTSEELRDALDTFVHSCSEITGIQPNRSFDAWAEDSLLSNGVAINPQAAAHCAVDHQRSVVFIRGVYAAINVLRKRFPGTPLQILYAGCGPFGTLMLPLLGKFTPGELNLNFLDYHQRSLDSLELLLIHFGLSDHKFQMIQADACNYRHPEKLHLVVAETMQKSLEQEPQFAVTANLASQVVPQGVFIPQRIEVALEMYDLGREKIIFDNPRCAQCNEVERRGTRYPLATVCTLSPESAFESLESTIVEIPRMTGLARFEAALFTRICVFEQYQLEDYESEITLPLKCHEMLPLAGGERYRVSYQLGSYPKFNLEHLDSK